MSDNEDITVVSRPVRKHPSGAVRRVTPNPDRPKLSEALEERFAPLDEAAARSYELSEDASALAKKVEQLFDSGVVHVELSASESLVHVVKAPPKKAPE
jgi:hypothetical protein